MASSEQPRRTRVVEEPKRSFLPFLAVAVVAAAVLYTVAQDRIHAPPQANAGSGDIRTMFSADDYPADAQHKGEEGTVQAALSIDASGRVTNCTIVRSSTYASLDDATCRILQRRARFRPARDAAGNPVADRIVAPPVTWRLEG
jgi:protein TonB